MQFVFKMETKLLSMTRAEKVFIKKYIHIPWSVQLLFLAINENSTLPGLNYPPFTSINGILEFGDVPFYKSISADLALAYLPENSPLIFYEMNQLLVEDSGYEVATISLKSVNEDNFGNITPNSALSMSIKNFKRMMVLIREYMSLQLKPEFNQSALDNILDELKEKPVEQLSLLKQKQLSHFSQILNKKANKNK
jgi:hypothetical protein